jgi:hypothetical protein
MLVAARRSLLESLPVRCGGPARAICAETKSGARRAAYLAPALALSVIIADSRRERWDAQLCRKVDESTASPYDRSVALIATCSNRTAPSFNGRTPASGAGYRGSNPWGAASRIPSCNPLQNTTCGRSIMRPSRIVNRIGNGQPMEFGLAVSILNEELWKPYSPDFTLRC